jgi:response regulator RpfG family c-di-GMP phosphodiesterase
MKTAIFPSNGSGSHHVPKDESAPQSAQSLFTSLLNVSLVLRGDWEALSPLARDELLRCSDKPGLLAKLVEYRLLTEYQSARIEAGRVRGLILGNYRVLERIGAGGMGVVFKAEHLRLRRLVAVKVLALSLESSCQALLRFDSEMQAVARLQHPNIVAALDAGEVPSTDAETPVLHYYVMEYVPGQDLEDYVKAFGPLAPTQACDLSYQLASALSESHKHRLVHRDLKPSNVLRTPEGQAKLLDFGLAQHFDQRLTQPGVMLGTVEYMAPEQAQDASSVDIRADIYGLGGILYWCLTGHPPFEAAANVAQEMVKRQTQPPPSIRTRQPSLPAELDAVVARMMACNKEDRYPTPQAVMNSLMPFLQGELSHAPVVSTPQLGGNQRLALPGQPEGGSRVYNVLLVDDEPSIRQLCKFALKSDDMNCDEAPDGFQALTAIEAKPYDLLLLDIAMPGMTGVEVCQKLRKNPPSPHMKIIMFSGHTTGDEMAQVLSVGADDYVTKPFSTVQLRARVKAALRLKDAQDRSDLLNRHLLAVNQQLEQHLDARDSDLVHARNALVAALARLVEHRESEAGGRVVRLQRYSVALAEEAARAPQFAGQIDANFIRLLECCVPLHDIGKVGLPDHILLKPGKLDADERVLMQTHTIIGAELLQQVAREHGSALAFLQMAIDIARHHHERYDGKGYPDRLGGSDIPLAARIVTVGDVYDALRSRRSYKPALSHTAALQVILGSEGQFDPALLQTLERCNHQFERVFREYTEAR